ncbi:MAG: alpha-glucan phosphorylase, partial [Clostridia bacterium]|nr:alpha-glucan phosphorylase [Clostridia bacterium]
MSNTITEKDVKDFIKGKLSRYYGVSPAEATKDQIYKAVVMSVRDILLEKRQHFHKKIKAKRAKRVYYLCMEFLLGRSLKNSLYNLSATSVFE